MLKKQSLFQVLQQVVDSKRKKIKSTQDSLNYINMYKNGICQVSEKKYNKMIQFPDISYQLSQDEMKQRIFAQYSSLLNSFDDTLDIQFSFINYRLNERTDFEEVIEYNKDIKNFETLREEYFSFLQEQKSKGNNGIVRNKYIIFTVEENSYEHAVRRLETVENIIKQHLKTMGSMSESLSGIERLSILNYLLNGNDRYYLDIENVDREILAGTTSKDLIAPKFINYGRDPESFQINRKLGATLYLNITATELSDRVLADFLELDMEMLISMHVKSLEQQKAVRMVKTKSSDLDSIKIEEQKKAFRSGYDMDILPSDLNASSEESKNILQDLQRDNERYFYMTFTITVIANSEKQLDDYIYELESRAQRQNCSLLKMKYQQEKAFMSALPLGNNLNETELERGLTTSATSIFIPFTTQELYQEDNEPVYYGLNAVSNNMIQVSRKSLKNPNGLFLGTPGSGKSFSAKREIIDNFLRTKDDILICDPENEYYDFVKLLGGEIINISPNSVDFINPFDISMDYGEGSNPISFKSDFIMDMIALIHGGKQGLTGKEKSIIDKCVRNIYRSYLDNPVEENIPVFEDLYNELLSLESQQAREIAESLELYVHGSLNVFNNRTSINIENRLVCFNIQELGSNLKELGMLILQDYVWNKVTQNRNQHKKTWYYMDEFHVLLASEQTSSYSVEFWKRFRKWGGIPTGMTQNVKDLLSSAKIETILDNSDFIYLLNQASSDRRILQDTLEFSDEQASYITNSSEGEGLLYYAGNILPFKDKFPKNNSLYPVMTTKADEVKALRNES